MTLSNATEVDTASPLFRAQHEELLEATRRAYTDGVERYLSDGAFRDFSRWCLSPGNPRRDRYFELIAITQLGKLTCTLLHGIVDDPQSWRRCVRMSQVMNVWQVFEVVSDNLAIGLAHPPIAEQTAAQGSRRRLLDAFNTAMVEQLGDGPCSADQLDARFQGLASEVSLFEHSHAPDQHRAFASHYLAEHPSRSLAELEFSAWTPLTANVLSCRAMTQEVGVEALAELLIGSLRKRYIYMGSLLRQQQLSEVELLESGTHTILVIPTLAYYIAALAESEPLPQRLQPLLEDGTLEALLCDAALAVRLLNDIGTGLLVASGGERQALLARLARAADRSRPDALIELLRVSAVAEPLLNRIEKDAQLGEFNLALHGITACPSDAATIAAFGERLAGYSRAYADARRRLDVGLARAALRLGARRIPALIHRFVAFHHALYQHRSTSQAGEYAV